MRDLMVELKQLRLHGMALAWPDCSNKAMPDWTPRAGCSSICWRLKLTDRSMRSVSHQMHAASSRCIAIWPASTSSRRWTAS